MGLGSRGAHRHETVASKTAGVDPSVYWDFQPGQRVMTVDGFAGTVSSVNDGPLAGTETYLITLANNLGGGEYTASQLRAASDTTGAVHHTADQDYPELGTILTDRPDIALNTVMASRRVLASDDVPEEYEEHWPYGYEQCPECHQMINTEQVSMDDHLREEHQAADADLDRYHQGARHQGANDNEHGIETFEGIEPNDGAESGVDEHGHLTWDGFSPGCRDTDEYSMFGQNDAVEHGQVAGTPERERRQAAASTPCYRYPGMIHTQGACTCFHNRQNKANANAPTWPDSQTPQFSHTRSAAFDPWAILTTAATDPEFGFHVTAAWSDVRSKAKRIRSEGRVHVTMAREGMVMAEVKGDHHTYETGLQRLPGKNSVAQWSCGCKWGAYHWGADDDFSRFAGRMCSHALAVHYEAQARGMFGRTVVEDDTKPSWAPRRVVVKHDIDTGRDITAPATPFGPPSTSVAASLIRHAVRAGEDIGEVTLALHTAGAGLGAIQAAVNDAWGEPDPPRPSYLPGPTMPADPSQNPASAGWAAAPDPESWSQQGPISTMPVTTAAFEDAKDRRTDVCANCGQAVHDAGGVDPNVPWVHTATGNSFCDVHGPADATLLAGSPLERPEASPTIHESSLDDAMFEPEMSKEAFWPLLIRALPALAEVGEAGAAAGEAGAAAGEAGGASQVVKKMLPSLPGGKDDEEQGQSTEQRTTAPSPSGPSRPTGPSDPHSTDPLDYGAQATFHDEPEPALPATDGDLEDEAFDLGSPTSLEPEDPSFVSTGAAQDVGDIVANFQATAGAKALQSGGARANSDGLDIAAAAKEHLAKSALKDFTPAEQAQIINEGENVRAANLDRLDITGTHYAPLEEALSAAEQDDDESWMS